MSDTKHRSLWMVSIIALLGALAYVALRPPTNVPAAPAAAPGPISPAAPALAVEHGPLGPFAADVAPAALAPASPGDWAMEGQNPGRTRATASSLPLPLTRQRAVMMPADREAGSPPVVARGLLLVETKSHLRAFDMRTGRERWAFTHPGSYISPAVAGDYAYIRAESDNKGQLIALDLQTGMPAWRFTPRRLSSAENGFFGGHLGAPLVVGGTLFVGAGKELYALDAATGATRWEFAAQDYITSSATAAAGRVYISDFDYIYAIDQGSGALLWSYPAQSAISFSPVATEQSVLVTSGSAVVALDGASGRRLWELNVPGEKLIPAGAAGGLAFVKSTETLYAVGLADGREAWRFRETNFVSLPALAGTQVFVVSGVGADSAVQALDSATGRSVWRQPVRSLASTAPVIAGGAVYVRMEDGRVLGMWS
ncbi:MAG TPA: PQQ-binding-like beta-propeller repeat protein [Roseiflexaceae bacterium]|nr:PQQ-binding-like beta-propeller repeat protein [Roseiflexaceae bacterium]